jgi:excinuclease ABC subunit C
MSRLEQKLNQLPQDSGVYLMKDKRGAIIYVGKAKNLKNRVSSYFHSSNQHSYKTRALVSEIVDLDLMLTKTEVEALLLERTLIRHHQPRFNILLRDDKEYPLIRICLDDPWPRMEKVRRRKDDGAHYIGPFGSASRLSLLLRQVYRIFPLIRCSPHEFKAATRPCNYYHMKMCMGPCTLPVDRDVYLSHVRSAISMLEGQTGPLREQLAKKMQEAAERERYELAAQYRDQIRAIESMAQNQVAILSDLVDADVIGMIEKEGHIGFHVLTIRQRTLLGGDPFIVPTSADTPPEAMSSFILQYYAQRVAPQLILVRDASELSLGLGSVLSEERPIQVTTVKAGEARDLLEIAERNAIHQLDSQYGQKQQQQVGLQLLQETLGLETWLERIECIDISNLQGTAIVASNVCFIQGKPAKEFYRRYQVKTVSGGPDDFASIREVVERRLERGLRDDDLPNLLMIDGGRPQVQAAMSVLQQFPQLHLPLVGLAKSRLDKGLRNDQQAISSRTPLNLKKAPLSIALSPGSATRLTALPSPTTERRDRQSPTPPSWMKYLESVQP